MKLSKEECLRAYDRLCNTSIENDYDMLKREDDSELIYQLMNEYFENQPLKFEELCENEPIFDNDDFYYCWYLILMIDYETKQLYIVDYDGNFKWINFEENRFYRKQVEE